MERASQRGERIAIIRSPHRQIFAPYAGTPFEESVIMEAEGGRARDAELDAWYVLGVERVENRIEVHPGMATGVR